MTASRIFETSAIHIMLGFCFGHPMAFSQFQERVVPAVSELAAIQDIVGSQLANLRGSQDDDKDYVRLRATHAVIGLLINKASSLRDNDIAQSNSLAKEDKAVTTVNPSEVEKQRLTILRDGAKQKTAFIQLNLAKRAGASNALASGGLKQVSEHDWLFIWDSLEMQRLDREAETLQTTIDALDTEKKEVTLKKLSGYVEQSLKVLKDDYARFANYPSSKGLGDVSSNELGSKETESVVLPERLARDLAAAIELLPLIPKAASQIEVLNKKELKDRFLAFNKEVASLREQIVMQIASSVVRERNFVERLLKLTDLQVPPWEPSRQAEMSNGAILNSIASLSLCVASLEETLDAMDKPKESTMKVSQIIRGVWNYALTFGEDASVTLGELVLLILSLSTAILLSFLCSKLIARCLEPWFGISKGVAIAWRLIIRNVLALLFTFIAFQLFGVPLTAFAFVGGAAALAVGFGSKDIANNFMSGIIILTEQPVRVNDVVVYDSKQCLVTYIGLRSTRLKNIENHELVVPNSVMIDRLVTNLTLSDKLIRLVLPIEVDRTENVEGSIQRMIEALQGLTSINHERPPVVFLKSVDTYYLNFEVHVTVEFNDLTEMSRVQSEVFSAIARLFPSRTDAGSDSDAHLDNADLIEQPSADATGSKSDDQSKQDNRSVRQSWMGRSKKEIEHEINELRRELGKKRT